MKTCKRCGISKPHNMLVKNPNCTFGVRPFCLNCRAETRVDKVPLEIGRQRQREWYQNNKDKKVVSREAYRARRANAEGSFTLTEWKQLCDMYDNKCLSCGANEVTIDHVVPLTMGGTNYIDNIQPLCTACNSSKNNKIIDYRPAP